MSAGFFVYCRSMEQPVPSKSLEDTMSERNRYSSVQVNNGEVIATEFSEWLEVSFLEMVAIIQRNVASSYWGKVDTDNGAVHVARSGLVTVWSVQTK